MQNFDDYQNAVKAFAIYPGHSQPSIAGLIYTALELGEAGEYQGKVKKILRDDGGKLTPERREQLIGELGDVLFAVSESARHLGIRFCELAERNHEKLHSRFERGKIQGDGDER